MVSLLAKLFSTNLLYIDPAATSMLLTSITAIVVACGAGIFIAWRAFKKKVNKAFHIDENAKKEVEDELVISDEVKEGEEGEQAPAEDKAEQPAEEKIEQPVEEAPEVKEEAVAAKPKKKSSSKKSN